MAILEAQAERATAGMKKLAIVRHGIFDFNQIIPSSRLQLEEIGKLLKPFQGREGTLIVSSPAPRALASAEVLNSILHGDIEQYPELWSDSEHSEDLDQVYKLIQDTRSKAGLVVAVTHLEIARDLPGILGEKDFGKRFSRKFLENGEGILLDYSARTMSLLQESLY